MAETMTRAEIMDAQRMLNRLGIRGQNGRPLRVDGISGRQTQFALAAYARQKQADAAMPTPRPNPMRGPAEDYGRPIRPFRPGERRNNPDGSYSTELLTTVPRANGQWGNVPSLWMTKGGPMEVRGDDQNALLASQYEDATHTRFPQYPTLQAAEEAARARSAAGGASRIPLAMPFPVPKPAPEPPAPPGLAALMGMPAMPQGGSFTPAGPPGGTGMGGNRAEAATRFGPFLPPMRDPDSAMQPLDPRAMSVFGDVNRLEMAGPQTPRGVEQMAMRMAGRPSPLQEPLQAISNRLFGLPRIPEAAMEPSGVVPGAPRPPPTADRWAQQFAPAPMAPPAPPPEMGFLDRLRSALGVAVPPPAGAEDQQGDLANPRLGDKVMLKGQPYEFDGVQWRPAR